MRSTRTPQNVRLRRINSLKRNRRRRLRQRSRIRRRRNMRRLHDPIIRTRSPPYTRQNTRRGRRRQTSNSGRHPTRKNRRLHNLSTARVILGSCGHLTNQRKRNILKSMHLLLRKISRRRSSQRGPRRKSSNGRRNPWYTVLRELILIRRTTASLLIIDLF